MDLQKFAQKMAPILAKNTQKTVKIAKKTSFF
jgi:hypothetical protein